MTPAFALKTLAAAALCSAMALARPQAPALNAPAETEAAPSKDLKTKLFLVQHRSAQQLKDLLAPLTSGTKGVRMEYTDRDGLKAITVRDFPENLAAIGEALKRLDVPGPARREVELRLHVLVGSRQDAASEAVPEELKPVLSSLRSTLAYRSYTQAISFVLRAATGDQSAKGRGSVEGIRLDKTGQGEVRVDYFIRAIGVEAQEGGPARLTLKGFSLEAVNQATKDSLASLSTDLAFKDGETVVVGTSAFKDKGLIVVVSAKLLN